MRQPFLTKPSRLGESTPQHKPEWDESRIAEAAGRDVEQSVPLDKPWPVNLLDWTAWVGSAGDVHLRPDIDQRDEKLAAVLDH